MILVLLAILGPDPEEVKKRFEFPGAEGVLKIMPEISISPGVDAVEQMPRYFRETPPPPAVEVRPDDLDPLATETMPITDLPSPQSDSDLVVEADPDLEQVNLVEFSLPQQTNPDFVLIRMVRPQYPANATEQQRRTPVIRVEVAIYIAETGEVTASMILSSDGGVLFEEVVLKAVNQWLYKPIVVDGHPPEGRWQTLTWRFLSPYLRRR